MDGGILVQDTDTKILSLDDFKVVTVKQPAEKDFFTALFTWKVLRHAKSNGILISKNKTTLMQFHVFEISHFSQ